MVRKGLTVVPGGHLSVILVIIIGFWQGKVKILPGMGLAYLHICKVFGFGALSWPLNRSRIPEKRLKLIGETIWGPFLVSLAHLGASTGLRSQQFCIGFTAPAAFWAIF